MIPQARRRAYACATGAITVGAVVMGSPEMAWVQASGPATPGHEAMDCQTCHQEAPGTMRQQLQANVAYWLGRRPTLARVRFDHVRVDTCVDCHDRPADRHAIERFREPRFHAAREALGGADCMGCHTEHQGRRVTAPVDACRHCHAETRVKDDPANPSHATLMASESWSTCLRCHDFHGNHDHAAPAVLTEALTPEQVEAHLAGHGADAYGAPVVRARSEVTP